MISRGKDDRKLKKISYLVMIVWFAFSLYNDLHFFDFSWCERVHFYISNGNPNAILYFILCKIATVIFINSFRIYVLNILQNFREHNIKEIRRYIYILILLSIYMAIIYLMYPGIWWANDADEFTTLGFVKNLQIQYNQGALQSIFYTMALMIYPDPVMVIILQVVIGIGVLGDMIYDSYCYTNNKLGFMLRTVLLFTPACIYFALYPMRAWMFAVAFAVLCYKCYEVEKFKDGQESNKDKIMMLLSLILIINCRSESKILIIVVPFLMCIWGIVNKRGVKKEVIRILSIMLCTVVVFSVWNKIGNQATKKTHSILFLIQPMGNLIQDPTIDLTSNQKELDAISKIINLEIVNPHDTQGEIDESLFTQEQYKAGVYALIKMNLKFPGNYLSIKWKNMLDSIGLTEFRNINYEFPQNVLPQNIRSILYCKTPKVHNMIGKFLAGDVYVCGIPIYYIFYSFWIPCLFGVVIWVYGIVRKKWEYIIPFTLLLAEMAVVILFSPVHYTMYYFYMYLAGWILIIGAMTERRRELD